MQGILVPTGVNDQLVELKMTDLQVMSIKVWLSSQGLGGYKRRTATTPEEAHLWTRYLCQPISLPMLDTTRHVDYLEIYYPCAAVSEGASTT